MSEQEDISNQTWTENAIAKVVVDCSYKIYMRLGPGLLESVYEASLAHELRKRGLKVERQVLIPVFWDGMTLDNGFRADLIIESKLIIELKSVEKMLPVFGKQLNTYLRLTDKRLGLLINFGHTTFKDAVKRVANGLQEE